MPLAAKAETEIPEPGTYLAARHASFTYDFKAAAEYYGKLLETDPSNPMILESALVSHVALGQIEAAETIARKMEEAGQKSLVPHMILMAVEAKEEAFSALIERTADRRGFNEFADMLVTAWAHLGQGKMDAALAAFDEAASLEGLYDFAMYHKALALASVGDFESANAIFAKFNAGPGRQTRRGILAWAQVLSQLDRNKAALELLEASFGGDLDPEIKGFIDRIENGESLPFDRIGGAADGVAEVYYTMGLAVVEDGGEELALIYSRLAHYLDPENVDTIIISAELLERLGRYELATEIYRQVPNDHPAFHAAEMGRSEALRQADRTEAAIEVLNQLAKSHANLPDVHVALGDIQRQQENFEKAVKAYDKAITIYEEHENVNWFAYYARGIAHERLDQWEQARSDFHKALDLNPDQPQVLNYLGYSMIEQHVNLEEALGLIEKAVRAQPQSGYIVDSLGWALFRLGRYEEAVKHMERAVELTPVDPVLNDHLGDVLWAVGRYGEARFQWQRALSFIDSSQVSTDADPERIRRKLEKGLDKVLAEEGAAPLKVAGDEG